MARQGGRVQLELSDMRLALNMAKMAKGGFSRASIEGTQFLIKKPPAEVREEKKQGVECPEYKYVKAAMERHPAMLWENQTDGCLPCQNGTAQNPQTRWRRKGTGAPPPERLRQPTPEPTPHPPEMPHQQQTIPSGRNRCIRVDALSQSRQRHPGGSLLHARRQYNASCCI